MSGTSVRSACAWCCECAYIRNTILGRLLTERIDLSVRAVIHLEGIWHRFREQRRRILPGRFRCAVRHSGDTHQHGRNIQQMGGPPTLAPHELSVGMQRAPCECHPIGNAKNDDTREHLILGSCRRTILVPTCESLCRFAPLSGISAQPNDDSASPDEVSAS